MKKEIKPFKISFGLTPEQSTVIQKTLFENGHRWGDGSIDIKNTDKHSITLTPSDRRIYYNPWNSSPEIIYQQFYDMYVERYFRLKPTAVGWKSELNSKKIFKGSYISSVNIQTTVLDHATEGPNNRNWEEVTYEDWLNQEQAKNKIMQKVEVRVDFLKELHQEVCTPLKTKMEKELPEVFKPITYKLGQRFTNKYEGVVNLYLLAYLGNGKIGLVELSTGLTFYSIDAKDINVKKITQQDWPTLFNNFVLVE